MQLAPRAGRLRRIWNTVDDASWRAGLWLYSHGRADVADRDMLALMPGLMRRDGKLLVGRNGRLFLSHDSHRVVDQHAGRLTFSEHELAGWHALIEERTERLRARGSTYLMLVAPNAHAVYPEDLPAGVHGASERPVHQLLSRVSRNGAGASVLYPVRELIEGKREREVFPRTETHWNEFGAFIAYTAIARALRARGVRMRVLDADELQFFELAGVGDLGLKRRWPRKSAHAYGRVRHASARLLADNLVDGTGALLVTECPVAEPSTCVICGDSYTVSMLPFLAESFGRVVFARTPALDWDLIERERPSVVLTVISERFLMGSVPDDDDAPSTEELAVANIAQGHVRTARWDRWDAPRHPSPAQVERIRARLAAEGRAQDAAMVSTLAYAGLDPGELFRLRWRNVSDDAIRIRTAPTGRRRVPAREWPWRSIPLAAPLAADLAAWKAEAPASGRRDLVFPPPEGEPWDRHQWRRWVTERFEPHAAELGLEPPTPRSLQKTFIALRINAGDSAADLAALLGVSARAGRKIHSGFCMEGDGRPVSPEAEIERARALAAARPVALALP